MSLRFIRFWALRRNSIAAHLTRRNRIRLIRWMRIGTLTRPAPAAIVHGLTNSEYIAGGLVVWWSGTGLLASRRPGEPAA